jgi:DNA-binding NtrC family response regulator
MRKLGRRGSGGILPEHRSPAMARLYEEVRRMAAHDLPVLVRGETGVGKEHVSRLLHELSPRASQPFVAINCGELERHLLRSELFGHEKGAFTGADTLHRGLFELGGEGTLMLDEVAEMPMDAQASLLRVLESGRFRRVGGSAELRSRVRIVAATNKDLRQRVREGQFREDLYFRLVAVELRVPSLRERPEDIPLLAADFVHRAAVRLGEDAYLAEGALARLAAYHWPGNVRELRNVVERSVLIHGGGKLEAGQIALGPDPVSAQDGPLPESLPADAVAGEEQTGFSSTEALTLEEVEKQHVRRVLASVEGNRSRAARLLGIARSTLLRKLERWQEGTPPEEG